MHVIGWLNTSRLSTIVHHFTFWYIKRHLPAVYPLTVSKSFCNDMRSAWLATGQNSFVLSANFSIPLVVPTSRSLINIKNKTGSSTEPWGTPLKTCCQLELEPSNLTFCHLSFNHADRQHHQCHELKVSKEDIDVDSLKLSYLARHVLGWPLCFFVTVKQWAHHIILHCPSITLMHELPMFVKMSTFWAACDGAKDHFMITLIMHVRVWVEKRK